MTTPTKDTQDYTRLGNLSPEYLLATGSGAPEVGAHLRVG